MIPTPPVRHLSKRRVLSVPHKMLGLTSGADRPKLTPVSMQGRWGASMASSFIFLSYAREDQDIVQQLYLSLKNAGLEPWMDKPPQRYPGMRAGQDWRNRIKARIKRASLVLIFLSKAAEVDDGFFWEEIRYALDELSVRPLGMTWLIPILIEKCQAPPVTSSNITLGSLHWHDLQQFGRGNLIEYLKTLSGSKIEPAHLTLVHATWRAQYLDKERGGNQVFKFDVALSSGHSILGRSACREVLDRVDWVTYLLPPAWPNSPVTVADRRRCFGHRDIAWTDFLIRANVYIKGEDHPIHLSSFITLFERGYKLFEKAAGAEDNAWFVPDESRWPFLM
jgi:hypothetical protein